MPRVARAVLVPTKRPLLGEAPRPTWTQPPPSICPCPAGFVSTATPAPPGRGWGCALCVWSVGPADPLQAWPCSRQHPRNREPGRWALTRCPGHEETGWREGDGRAGSPPIHAVARSGPDGWTPVPQVRLLMTQPHAGLPAGGGRPRDAGEDLLPHAMYSMWVGSVDGTLAVLRLARDPVTPRLPPPAGPAPLPEQRGGGLRRVPAASCARASCRWSRPPARHAVPSAPCLPDCLSAPTGPSPSIGPCLAAGTHRGSEPGRRLGASQAHMPGGEPSSQSPSLRVGTVVLVLAAVLQV